MADSGSSTGACNEIARVRGTLRLGETPTAEDGRGTSSKSERPHSSRGKERNLVILHGAKAGLSCPLDHGTPVAGTTATQTLGVAAGERPAARASRLGDKAKDMCSVVTKLTAHVTAMTAGQVAVTLAVTAPGKADKTWTSGMRP